MEPPVITPLSWVSARNVLPHEAHDFTPWLAANLDLLLDPLGLDQLDLVATEWSVDSFSLDILAQGVDPDGDVTVCIENQYGPTDHKHLGQLLTYAAHAAATSQRVLAVWLTEEVRPAHLATVDLLNRIGAENGALRIVVMRVRFAPSPTGHHVHFEVDAKPNSFLRAPTPTPRGIPPRAVSQAAFALAVSERLDGRLASFGFTRRGKVNEKHGSVAYHFPADVPLNGVATARVVSGASRTNLAFYIESEATTAGNWAIAEALRLRYAELAAQNGIDVTTWHGSSASVKRDRVITEVERGYADAGAVDAVVAAAEHTFGAWVQMMRTHPLPDLASRAAGVLDEPDEDDLL